MASAVSKTSYVLFILLFFRCIMFLYIVKDSNTKSIQVSAECVQSKLERFIDHNMWILWGRFAYVVNKCSPTLAYTSLEAFPNNDEYKYHFLPLEKLPNCSIISLGIGKDVRAEKRMKSVMPDCQFFGADPVTEDNLELYSEFGQFYNMAVGDKNGSFRSYVLEDIYRYQEVPYIDLATFIKLNVKQTIIDQIMLDIEHNEYPLLPFFEEQGVLEQKNIHICQINIEIHIPSTENQVTFGEFLKNNFISQKWIFINSEIHPILGHIRLFMVNGKNEECLRRYLIHR